MEKEFISNGEFQRLKTKKIVENCRNLLNDVKTVKYIILFITLIWFGISLILNKYINYYLKIIGLSIWIINVLLMFILAFLQGIEIIIKKKI